MANLEIAGAHKRTQKGNVDYYYGGDNEAWADLASAKAGVPSSIRPGKTVGVYINGEIVEYWWPDASNILDTDLVVKEVPLPQGLSTTDTPTFAGVNSTGNIDIDNDKAVKSKLADGTPVTLIEINSADELVIGDSGVAPPAFKLLGVPHDTPGGTVLYIDYTSGRIWAGANYGKYRGKFTSLSSLSAAITGTDGDYAIVSGSPDDEEYIWDNDSSTWVLAVNTPASTFAALGGNATDNASLASALNAKVDKISGKGLSTNDYTTDDQTKLSGIANGATADSAATLTDAQTGTDTSKFIVSSVLASWWTWVKTQVQTISGIWNFSNGLQSGGLTTIQSSTPELRLTTTDNAYARLQRNVSLSNNLFEAKNQVVWAGGIGRCLSFVPSSYIDASDVGLPTGAPNFSISVWFKMAPYPTNSTAVVFAAWGGTGTTGIQFGTWNGGLRLWDGSGAAQFAFGLGVITESTTQWNHAVLTLSGTTVKTYLNGSAPLVNTVPSSFSLALSGSFTTAGKGSIAIHDNTFYMDQLIIYNTVLSDTNAASLYNGGAGTSSPPSNSNIIRRYEFDEGTGLLTYDLSSNNATATLHNGVQWGTTGITPSSGTSSETSFFTSTDGVTNAEKGISTWGDYNGRNQQQGKWFQWYQNNAYPLVSNNTGQFIFNPNSTSSSVPNIASTVDIAGNLTIGSTLAGVTAAPTNGLCVQGQSNFGDIVNVTSTTPEQRFTTSDNAYARLRRTTISSNNEFYGSNQVLKVGGIGNAVKFNGGLNESLTFSDIGLGSTGSISISFWMKLNVPGSQAYIFDMGSGSGRVVFRVSTSGYAQAIWNAGAQVQQHSTPKYVADNQWHHIVLTYSNGSSGSNGTGILYVDNVSVSGSFTTVLATGTGANVTLGAPTTLSSGNVLTIDQLLIYNSVLSSTDVTTIYGTLGAGTYSVPTSNLMRRYEFEENNGVSTVDISGNNITAALNNGVQWDSNGKTPVSGASSEASFLTITDGVTNSEKGVATWGDYNGRNQQQGKWFQWYQNNNFPLVSNNTGQFLFNPNNTSSSVPTIGSTVDIGGNLSIGSTYVGISAPSDGLIIEGQTGIGTNSPDTNAILDLTSTSKVLALPSLTSTQISVIPSPAERLFVYDNTNHVLKYYDNTSWRTLVGRTTIDTLTNKTITSSTNTLGGVTMTLGSDAAYDLYYRNSSGILTRLPNGTTGQVLYANTGAAPTWFTPQIWAGSYSSTGSSTTTFTVTLPITLADTAYSVNVTPSNSLSATSYYINNKTTSTFDVVYTTGLTGSVAFDWTAIKQ